MRFVIATLLAATLAATVLPAYAHHANGPSFDEKKHVTLTGTVTKFIFRNPHPYLYFDVADKNGQKTEWVIEFNGATIISKSKGWTKDTVKAGDVITATGRPSFVGHAMHVDVMTRADGTKIY
jgi:hypothetical protein